MTEKVFFKSKARVNVFLVVAVSYFLVGFIVASFFTGFAYDIKRFFYYSIFIWDPSFYVVWPSLLIAIWGVIVGGAELTITDQRVYGKVNFLKKVDIPISAILNSRTCPFYGVTISTIAGAIPFLMLKDNVRCSGYISELARRANLGLTTDLTQKIPFGVIQELEIFKKALDGGVISLQEYESKMKQLLQL